MVDPVKPHVQPMWGTGTATPPGVPVSATSTDAAHPSRVPMPQSLTPPTTTTVATVTTTTAPASSTVLWYQSQRFVILCQSSALLVLAWLGTALATNDWAWRVIAISVLGNVALQLK